MSQVENWKIPIPSYDLFPTVPLTFDEVFWETYWQNVNKSVSIVREVLIKLEKETKLKMVGNKQKLEKDETQEKKQEELKRKRRRIMESPTQSPLRTSPDCSPEKMEVRPTPSPIPNLPDLSPPPRVRINLFSLSLTCFVNPLIHMFLSILYQSPL